MTAPPPSIPVVHARKTAAGGVVAFADETMTGKPLASWSDYATNRPDMRQRYVTIDGQSVRVIWHS